MAPTPKGALRRADTEEQKLEAETLVNLVRLGWGRDDDTLGRVFTHQFIPGGTAEQHRWWTELERISATSDDAARILEAFHRVDVSEAANRLHVPTLVMHARGDRRVRFEQGRLPASLIPNAHFVPLESDNHVLLETEAAWSTFSPSFASSLDRKSLRGSGQRAKP